MEADCFQFVPREKSSPPPSEMDVAVQLTFLTQLSTVAMYRHKLIFFLS